MNKLWHLAFRNLWTRKTRTLVTALGILLGVAAMFAVSVMGASTAQSLKDFFAQSSGRANLTITDAGTSGEGFPRRTLARLQAHPSVVQAVGMTSKSALLQTKDKTIALTLIGIDPEADARVRTYKIARGQFLDPRSKSHNILLVVTFANDHAIALDDTLTFQMPNGALEKFRVIGLLADEGAGHLNAGKVGFITLDVSQTVFERGSRLDQIDLVVTPEIAESSADLKTLKESLQDDLGSKFIVSLPTATGESVAQAISGLNVGLSFFSVIALFVGALLIYNTFQMTVAERTREIGMLRSLGASKRQVLSLIMVEAALLGCIGTALGIGGGMLLSIPLVKLMSNMMSIPLESFAVPTDGLIQAIIVGLVTTGIAAFLPAWNASRIAPTEALRARAGSREGFLLRHSWKFGIGLIALAVLDATGVFSLGQGPQFFIFLFLGVILWMPNIILLVERVSRRALTLVYGAMGPLGSRNLARSKVRTSLTVGVLMIGVVMTMAIGAMTASFRAGIDDWINAAVGGDFILSSADGMREELINDLRDVEGVAAVSPQRLLWQKAEGVTTATGFTAYDDQLLFLGIDPLTISQVSKLQFVSGENEQDALARLANDNAVFISTAMRDRWKVKRGDTVRLRTRRGSNDFEIAGVVQTFWSGGQCLYISRGALQKYFGDQRVNLFLIRKTADVSNTEIQARLKQALGDSKRIEIVAGDEYRASFQTQIVGFLLLFDAMVWIAIIVGALGVVNTMTMNVLERVREIGTLRSIGMSRGQLARMILAEAGAMGVIGALFGIVIAYPVSVVMVEGMREGSGFQVTYTFPMSAFVIGIVTALVISQVASLYPTWRAGRVNVIEAIKEE